MESRQTFLLGIIGTLVATFISSIISFIGGHVWASIISNKDPISAWRFVFALSVLIFATVSIVYLVDTLFSIFKRLKSAETGINDTKIKMGKIENDVEKRRKEIAAVSNNTMDNYNNLLTKVVKIETVLRKKQWL